MEKLSILDNLPVTLPYPEWQSIETAPKEGHFLVLSRAGYVGIALVQAWHHGGESGISEYAAWIGHKPYEQRKTLWMGGEEPSEAAYWMPFPEPPASADTHRNGQDAEERLGS